MPNALSSVDTASKTIACGVWISADTNTTNPIADTPCRRIKIIAPHANGPAASTNTSIVRYGDTSRPNDYITNDGNRDDYMLIDNASKVYFKAVTSGDKVEYRIES